MLQLNISSRTRNRWRQLLALGVLAATLLVPATVRATAPVWQASSTVAASTGANVTVTLPAHQAGDIMLLQVLVRDTDDTITWPTDWVQLATVDRGTSAVLVGVERAQSSSETYPLVSKRRPATPTRR